MIDNKFLLELYKKLTQYLEDPTRDNHDELLAAHHEAQKILEPHKLPEVHNHRRNQ